MSLYLAQGIEEGRLDYKEVFTNRHLVQLKESTDAMLLADGFGNLIVPLV